MRLVDQWRDVGAGLPGAWEEARLKLLVMDDSERSRAAALLAPLAPARSGKELRFAVRRGGAPGPEAVRRALSRLDVEGIDARLQLVDLTEPAGATADSRASGGLAAGWLAELDALPADWSDLYAEVRFDSSDFVDRGALLLSPANPLRVKGASALRFRCARRFGYGVAPGMARRCFERLDGERITGTVHVLRALSETDPNATQGPVWYVEGRAV